jgi:signal transduction histidine kinase/CheY-like chemotaxis protein
MSDENNFKNSLEEENAVLQSQLKHLSERLAVLQEKSVEEKAALIARLEESQKLEIVGRLAGCVADELANMLSVILGHTEIALSWIDSSHHLYEHLYEIYKASEHSAELNRQLLAFAARQQHTQSLQDLNQTVKGVLNLLKRLIVKEVKLVFTPFARPLLIRADPVHLSQILVNLCINAYEAIRDKGKIEISLATVELTGEHCRDNAEMSPGKHVIIKVADTGCGMTPEVLSRIYQPFYSNKINATGLGMPVCRELVRQNGGFMNVSSEPGRGSEFSIFFPEYVEQDVPTSALSNSESVNGNSATILLVDDDVALLGMTRKMLQLLGYKVLSFEKPSDAINLVKTNPGKIDLLLTDLVMPEMNGRTLAKSIEELRPGISCLYMSGYGENIIAHHGLMDSNVSFVAKPFTRDELAKALSDILSEGQRVVSRS